MLFPLTPGRAALCRRIAFYLFQGYNALIFASYVLQTLLPQPVALPLRREKQKLSNPAQHFTSQQKEPQKAADGADTPPQHLYRQTLCDGDARHKARDLKQPHQR